MSTLPPIKEEKHRKKKKVKIKEKDRKHKKHRKHRRDDSEDEEEEEDHSHDLIGYTEETTNDNVLQTSSGVKGEISKLTKSTEDDKSKEANFPTEASEIPKKSLTIPMPDENTLIAGNEKLSTIRGQPSTQRKDGGAEKAPGQGQNLIRIKQRPTIETSGVQSLQQKEQNQRNRNSYDIPTLTSYHLASPYNLNNSPYSSPLLQPSMGPGGYPMYSDLTGSMQFYGRPSPMYHPPSQFFNPVQNQINDEHDKKLLDLIERQTEVIGHLNTKIVRQEQQKLIKGRRELASRLKQLELANAMKQRELDARLHSNFLAAQMKAKDLEAKQQEEQEKKQMKNTRVLHLLSKFVLSNEIQAQQSKTQRSNKGKRGTILNHAFQEFMVNKNQTSSPLLYPNQRNLSTHGNEEDEEEYKYGNLIYDRSA